MPSNSESQGNDVEFCFNSLLSINISIRQKEGFDMLMLNDANACVAENQG